MRVTSITAKNVVIPNTIATAIGTAIASIISPTEALIIAPTQATIIEFLQLQKHWQPSLTLNALAYKGESKIPKTPIKR